MNIRKWLDVRLRDLAEKHHVRRYPSKDLRGTGADPLSAYYDHGGGPCLIEVELAHCRWNGFSNLAFGADSDHPLVRTALEFAEGKYTTYEGSYLQWYWSAWKPANLADALELDAAKCNPILTSTPPIHGIEPWAGHHRIEYLLRHRWTERQIYRTLYDGGFAPARSCGPKPDWFGERCFEDLCQVFERIRQKGYRSHAPDTIPYELQHIVVSCLERDGEIRMIVINGETRAAVLSAIGYTTAPALVHVRSHRGTPLVRRADAAEWPLVRAGIFTEAEAVSVFDRVFDGRQPAALARMGREPQAVVA